MAGRPSWLAGGLAGWLEGLASLLRCLVDWLGGLAGWLGGLPGWLGGLAGWLWGPGGLAGGTAAAQQGQKYQKFPYSKNFGHCCRLKYNSCFVKALKCP